MLGLDRPAVPCKGPDKYRVVDGVIIYSFYLNISPTMLDGVLGWDAVMLQNGMVMIL